MTPSEFISLLWGDQPLIGLIQLWRLEGRKSYYLSGAGEADRFAGQHDVYTAVGLAPRDLGANRRAKTEEVTAIAGLVLDLDFRGEDKPSGAPDPDAALEAAHRYATPTVVVHSGHGLQAWHLFEEPWPLEGQRDQAAAMIVRWHALHASSVEWVIDPCKDLARLMRLPGTVNAKREPLPVTVFELEGSRYQVEELAELCARAPREAEVSSGESAAPANGKLAAGHRHAEQVRLGGAMRRVGAELPEIEAALLTLNRTRCDPPKDESIVRRDAADICKRYAANVNGAGENIDLNVETNLDILGQPDPPEEDMLLGPLVVREQRTLFGGAKGKGKTTFEMHVIRAILHGERFLDWQGRASKILFVDAEQGLKSIKRKLRGARLDEGEFDYLRVPTGLALNSNEQHITALEQIIADGGYDLVMFDPLYKLHRGESNEERGMVDLMRVFDEWRTAHRFALWMGCHTRKDLAGRKMAMSDIFGSSGITWGAEIVLGLEMLRPGYSRLHFFADRDGDLPTGEEWGLLYDEHGFRRDPEDGKAKETAAEKVLSLVTDEPGLTIAQITPVTGYKEDTVKKALGKLEEAGDVVSESGPHNRKTWFPAADSAPPEGLEWD